VFCSVQLCEGYFAYTVKCLFYLKPAVVTGTYTSICRVISETKCHFPFQFILFLRREITYYMYFTSHKIVFEQFITLFCTGNILAATGSIKMF
jgi:hypothetical protein